MPLNNNMTLNELIEQVCHTTKYNNNSNLFVNASTLKDLDTDSDKEEEKNSNNGNRNQLGFINYNSINQGDSDNDDEDNIQTKKNLKNKAENPNYGAHKIFQLEVVFEN